ncbi:MAG: formyltetrahydrofolate deformylase [Bacteroidota bacterium]
MQSPPHAILLIHCPDQAGLINTVTDFVYRNKGNIVSLDQHVEEEQGVFFMRIAWEIDQFLIPREKIGEFFHTLIAEPNQMSWQLHFSDIKPKVALFVSKASHCLFDLLQRHLTGELACDIPAIVSNHTSLAYIAKQFDIPFYHFPITADTKAEQEIKEKELIDELNVELIVLARYMQILSADMCGSYPNRIINIHHSFLPAFKGGRPYQSAYDRGVKLIGATAHYVTSELDEGPIIAQDVAVVSHKEGINDLKRLGKDIEKRVLSRAVYLHLQRRVLPFGRRTIVFD